jgi:hypothetical protein
MFGRKDVTVFSAIRGRSGTHLKIKLHPNEASLKRMLAFIETVTLEDGRKTQSTFFCHRDIFHTFEAKKGIKYADLPFTIYKVLISSLYREPIPLFPPVFEEEELLTMEQKFLVAFDRIEKVCEKKLIPRSFFSFWAATMLIGVFPRMIQYLVKHQMESAIKESASDSEDDVVSLVLSMRYQQHESKLGPDIRVESTDSTKKIHEITIQRFRLKYKEEQFNPAFVISGNVRYFPALINQGDPESGGCVLVSGRVYFTYKELLGNGNRHLETMLAILLKEIAAKSEYAIGNVVKKYLDSESEYFQSKRSRDLPTLDCFDDLATCDLERLSKRYKEVSTAVYEFLSVPPDLDASQRASRSVIELEYEGAPLDHIDSHWPVCVQFKGTHPRNTERVMVASLIHKSYKKSKWTNLYYSLFRDGSTEGKSNAIFETIDSNPNGYRIHRCETMIKNGLCPYRHSLECVEEFNSRHTDKKYYYFEFYSPLSYIKASMKK